MTRVLLSFYDKEDFRSAILKDVYKSNILSTLDSKNFSHITILCLVDKNKVEKEDTFIQEYKAVSSEASRENPHNTELENFLNKYMFSDRMIEVFKREFEPLIKNLKKNIEVSFKKVETLDILNTDTLLDKCTDIILDSKKIIEKDFNEANKMSKGKKKKNQPTDKFANKKGYITILLNNSLPNTTIAWSFATLKDNNIEIQMITGVVENSSPKQIKLPLEYRSQIKVDTNNSKKVNVLPNKYDIMCHIYNKDVLSFYLTYKQFESGKHVVFYTGEENPHKILKNIVNSDTVISTVKINPNNVKNVRDSIIKHISSEDAENKVVGFNLSEGNTITGAGILFIVREYGAYSFQYDYNDFKVTNLETFENIDSYKIENVDEHISINLGNLKVKSYGRIEDHPLLKNSLRKELAENIYKNFDEYKGFYSQFPKENTTTILSLQSKFFRSSNGGITINLLTEGSKITINNKSYNLGNYEDTLNYLKGMWFEEYVFYKLLLLKDEGLIKDIRINYTIQNNSVQNYQEIDVLFTDGNHIYFIECKTGDFKSNYVYKIDNIVSKYGGPIGKGIIISMKKIDDNTHKERIKDNKNLYYLYGDNFLDEIRNLLKFGIIS